MGELNKEALTNSNSESNVVVAAVPSDETPAQIPSVVISQHSWVIIHLLFLIPMVHKKQYIYIADICLAIFQSINFLL